MTKQIDRSVKLESIEVRNRSFSEVETTARLLLPLNSSASNLARALSSSLNGTELSFQAIQTKVAPALFLAFSTIPLVSQVSYIGFSGLVFSFNKDDGETLAVFSNTTFSSNWYTQPVNRDTGKLYGDAVSSKSMVNSSWFQETLNQTVVHSSVGLGWNSRQDLLFQNTVAMDGRGVICIGFPAQVVIDQFRGLDFHGGYFHLATNDGQVLIQSKLPETKIAVNNGTVAVHLLKPNGDFRDGENHYLCNAKNDDSRYFHAKIRGMNYVFYCSILEIVGVKSVYILAFPTNGMETVIHKSGKLAVALFVLLFVIVAVALCIFIFLMIKSARREMFLCAALIKQMESTQQAERKSMNKSLAFANASHDIRAPLAAISGLIELCQEDAKPNSELATNLVQMNTCMTDLLGILNSVLDRCKIEAGKMQLEEEEFNLSQLLEDVVDMFYPIGMKKGVDVVLDPCDGSILKLNLVKGDRGKLKQILCNLLSNAVKFTSEGHVSIRAVVKKTTSKENAIIASNRNGVFNCLSALWCKKNGSFGDLKGIHTVQQDPNSMEFVFEVDDTGKGIPKDKQKSVFENFVQVKETALGQGGCGLGLGIVQSLVRLMGGEINIVDKEPGERGTCFRFNIFLATRDPHLMSDIDEQENYILNDGPSSGSHQHFGLYMRSPPSKPEGSHVVLLIAGEERRRVSKKVIENLGIKVSVVKRAKHKLDFLQSSSGRTELSLNDYLNKSSSSQSSPGRANDGSASSKDGQDLSLPPHFKKSGSKSLYNFVLIVIDSRAAHFSELCSLVANFRRDLQKSKCKIVWLDNPIARNSFGRELEAEDRPPPPCDHILSKPFHGSHLYRVLGLLPEFGGTYHCNSPRLRINRAQEMQHSRDQETSVELTSSLQQKHQLQEIVVHECDEQSSEKPLSGKKVLVVEDTPVLCKLATRQLSKLGAIVDVCENGKEAFDRVCKVLRDQRKEGHSEILPYHYIFMDCQMPIMSGYEATKLIREEEKHYGIRIPIIALTANAMAEEASKTKDAGMDFHLTKPLKIDKLLDAITALHKNLRLD